MGFDWQSGGITDVGTVRRINEDALLDNPNQSLWAVADGMGGYEAGDFASNEIVSQLKAINPAGSLVEATREALHNLEQANLKMCEQAALRNVEVIGSTVVVMIARDAHAVCLWVGDCRLYRYRDGLLEQLTEDHSRVQELVSAGVISKEEARHHPESNVVTRALGVGENVPIDLLDIQINPADTFILCSDGLTGALPDDAIKEALLDGDCHRIAHRLIVQSLDAGAKDNVSVIVVRASQEEHQDDKTVVNPNLLQAKDKTIVPKG